MRVNSGHRSIDNLEAHSGVTERQHCLQHSWQAELRLGFAEHEHSDRVERFCAWDSEWKGLPGEVWSEETPPVSVVLDEDLSSFQRGGQQKGRRIAKTSQAERHLQHQHHDNRTEAQE